MQNQWWKVFDSRRPIESAGKVSKMASCRAVAGRMDQLPSMAEAHPIVLDSAHCMLQKELGHWAAERLHRMNFPEKEQWLWQRKMDS